MSHTPVLHLRRAGTSLVLDTSGDGLPRVLHWGRDLGDLDAESLAAFSTSMVPAVPTNAMDDPVPMGLLPEAAVGWPGTPGLAVHRDGRAFSPRLRSVDVRVDGSLAEGPESRGTDVAVIIDAADQVAGIAVRIELELLGSGLVRQCVTLTNQGLTGGEDLSRLDVQGVLLTLPVPPWAGELFDLTGRHLRERSPQRHAFTLGTHLRENRRGRTGTDAATLLVAGEPGFGFGAGQVWGVHVAWSGDHRVHAEALPSTVRTLAGGELLLPGEVRLAPGEDYTTPYLYAGHAEGLDSLAARFHDYLRSRPGHPTSPRPVTLNTWEAVYFDHDLPRLLALADRAAQVGVERFVLDDGWFPGRDSDHAGLGDWEVDPVAWPQGLAPLVDHVTGLGMQFGLWVEPEMVNPDSDLARAHPDWILGPEGGTPPLSRNQQVLDLGRTEAYAHVLQRLDAVLTAYDISYLKWAHNRALVAAGGADGRAGVRAQTLAAYALMDELRRRHPGLEIESCSSGGGRVDLGVLERTDRVWASDCIDPVERAQIERWTAQLLPPELIGSHIGSPVSHTTGRRHGLDFRASGAFFGHLGIEWDITTADPDELARLGAWVQAHRAVRDLLHTGRTVRGDHPDPALWVHGVVSVDGDRALHALSQLTTSVAAVPGPVRLPGLDPTGRYRVRPMPPGDQVHGTSVREPAWWHPDGVVLPGRVLVDAGLQVPLMHPETTLLLESVRV